MMKKCKLTGKQFIAKSNRQKYCKSELCGECPLRTPKKNNKLDLVEIMEELTWEYERTDSIQFHLRNENISNGIQDDRVWGVGNMNQDLRLKPNLFESEIRPKKNVVYLPVQQLETGVMLGKVQHKTNKNQFAKSKLKYTDYFVNIETGQYKSTSIKIPYHLAIGLMNETQ